MICSAWGPTGGRIICLGEDTVLQSTPLFLRRGTIFVKTLIVWAVLDKIASWTGADEYFLSPFCDTL